MNNFSNAVYISWQDPKTLRFHPVGRLSLVERDDQDNYYEFIYIQEAEEAAGKSFHPFASFPDLNVVYRSRELFPMFGNRILSAKRADFPEYLSDLNLPESTRDPILILGRSEGRRVTDSLEMFPYPTFDPEYGFRTTFWARSIVRLNDSSRRRIDRLAPDEALYYMPDPQNTYDPRSIKLRTKDDVIVGAVPYYLLDDIHILLAHDVDPIFHVERISPSQSPYHERLLCRLDWPLSDRFEPFSSDRFQPIPPEASRPRAYDRLSAIRS